MQVNYVSFNDPITLENKAYYYYYYYYYYLLLQTLSAGHGMTVQ